MRTIRDIPILENIPVLVRAALNVPVERGEVVNEYRLQRALPTIRFLAKRGARIVLISHIGETGTETLEPVAHALGRLMNGISFFPETIGVRTRSAIRDLAPGKILVLENLRREHGERENDPTFARELAALADVFVEDSFDTCHRPHASIIGIPKILPSYAGLTLEEEIRELSHALIPKHPALAIIGGAKFNTKESVLTMLLEKYDYVFIGGALGNDFLKASGHEIGKSLVSNADPVQIKKLLANPKLVMPIDSIVISANKAGTKNERDSAHIVTTKQMQSDELILDDGPSTSMLLANLVCKVKTILWNGPLGNYENGFVDATDTLARSIAKSDAYSIVGGGDTIASIENLGLLSQFSFVSTGGGAMLEFLAKGTLPGIVALG